MPRGARHVLLQACERHAEAPPPSGCCSRMPTTARTMDCAAAVLFALGSWFLTRKLLPTHMRQYPGTNVTLPEGGAQIFVRDPQHLLAFVPDAQSSVGAVALRNLVVAHVVLLGVLAHWSRREGPVAVACICWAIGLTEVVTNSTKSYVGRLRPQFYTSCGWDEQAGVCTWDPVRMPDPKFVPLDSRHSFPSEHSSLAMSAGLLLTLYALRLLRTHGGSAPRLQPTTTDCCRLPPATANTHHDDP